jgi:dihydrodipicolinate synthase/N-acetylneuraminate lyase
MYKVTAAQRQRIFAVAKASGLSEEAVREVLYQISGQGTTAELSRDEAEEVIARLKDVADGKAPLAGGGGHDGHNGGAAA